MPKQEELMMRNATRIIGVLAATALFSCGGKTIRTDSTIQGNLDLASFPTAPAGVDAIDENGVVVSSKVGPAGAFKLSVDSGHSYQIRVTFASGSEPLVFPRSAQLLDLDFHVSSGRAIVALGAVRHFGSAPANGFYMQPAAGSAGGGDGECVDGVEQGTGKACVDDDAEVSCEIGDDDEQEGEHEDNASDGDGECENGVALTTGAACTDDALADPSQPMAVAEHNVPDEVGGCAEGEEGDEED